MLDIVPPTPSNAKRSASRSSRPARPARAHMIARRNKPRPAAPSPSVVKVDWKLPARLRRPVKQELARQRRKDRQRQAIVQFERRPIYSELPSQYPSYRAKPTQLGAEQHTGDVYRDGKPALQLPVPPYRTSFTTAARPLSAAPSSKLGPQIPPAAARKVAPPKHRAPARPAPLGLGDQVRDVPYAWQAANVQKKIPAELELISHSRAAAPSAIQAPRRRFALPLHFSIFPKNFLPRRRATAPVKKKITLPRLV